MLDFITNYGTFLLETLTLVAAILITAAGLATIAGRNKIKTKGSIKITKLNKKYAELKKSLNKVIASKEEHKELCKKLKQQQKTSKPKVKTLTKPKQKRIFVINFKGDLRATAVDGLREIITAILTVATPHDEVLAKIESGGGVIHGYGLAASQLKRIRDRNINLVVAVDKIAASGGYMMACVANKILAAPFAILGSLGVIVQLPNFHRLLKKHDIDFEQLMAGEYKRTLTVFGENTNKDRKKMQEEIDEAHELFKTFVSIHRPIVDMRAVATGEHWFGTKAQEKNLVDEIITSDDYLLFESNNHDIYEISYAEKKNFFEKIFSSAHKTLAKINNVSYFN